uniref:Uncharacterized protein n=1 Tax=Anguilla anguilla TaxID=7936 RepID=A0A0E9WQB8_ANGAN
MPLSLYNYITMVTSVRVHREVTHKLLPIVRVTWFDQVISSDRKWRCLMQHLQKAHINWALSGYFCL